MCQMKLYWSNFYCFNNRFDNWLFSQSDPHCILNVYKDMNWGQALLNQSLVELVPYLLFRTLSITLFVRVFLFLFAVVQALFSIRDSFDNGHNGATSSGRVRVFWCQTVCSWERSFLGYSWRWYGRIRGRGVVGVPAPGEKKFSLSFSL